MKDCICENIVNCDSSRELFRLSNQMMATFGDIVLPSNISQESLPDKFSEVFFLFVSEIEQIRSSLDPDSLIPTDTVEFSGIHSAEFQLIADDCVKAVFQEMPTKSCDLDSFPAPILHDCLEEITPIVGDIINKPWSSGVVSQCFKHSLVKHLC